MGLRAQKRQRARQAIIEGALSLLRDRGSARVRVAEVARTAEVSEATFFNYFASWRGVLDAAAHDWLDRGLASVGEAEGAMLRRAIRDFVRKCATQAEADPALAARLFVNAAARRPNGPGATPDPLVDLLTLGQRRGELRADVSAEALAASLRAALVAAMARWVATPAESRSPAEAALADAADLVLDGARKRHERVRPNAAAAPRA